MAGYPVFAPQPTPVDVRLFGEAAEAGTRIGNAIPSTTTAVIRGVQEGTKFAADLASEEARTEATKQATENAQTQNEIAKLSLDVDTQLHGEELDAKKATLEDATSKLAQDKNIREASDKFLQTFQAASPEAQKQMVFSGQNAQLFAQNPKLQEGVLQQLSFNPTLNQSERQHLNGVLKNKAIDDTFSKAAEVAYPKYLESQQDLVYGKGADTTNLISNQLKVAPEQAPYSGEWVPSGMYSKDPETGKVVLDPSTGQRKRNPIDYKVNPELKDRYDFISSQPDSNGQFVVESADKEQRDIQENFKSQTALQTGLHARYAKQFIQDNSGQTQQGAQSVNKGSEVGTFGSPASSTKAAAATEPPQTFVGHIQKQLNLSEPEAKAIEEPAVQLRKQMSTYIQDPNIRNDLNTKLSFNKTIGTMARSITDTQYKNSPTIQSQYTPSHVERYNQSLDDIVKSDSFSWLPNSALKSFGAVLNTFKVNTPEDLYYVNHGIAITSSLSKLVNSFMSQVDDRSKNAVTNNAAIQSRNSYLQGVRNGGRAPAAQ